jgi:hypothetical protein
MVFAVQPETTAATPLTVTVFPGLNPMPVIVTAPPEDERFAGVIESAYRMRA